MVINNSQLSEVDSPVGAVVWQWVATFKEAVPPPHSPPPPPKVYVYSWFGYHAPSDSHPSEDHGDVVLGSRTGQPM